MDELVVTLVMTVNEVNGILGALAKLPYEQSAAVIDKIRGQAVPQLPEEETPPALPEA